MHVIRRATLTLLASSFVFVACSPSGGQGDGSESSFGGTGGGGGSAGSGGSGAAGAGGGGGAGGSGGSGIFDAGVNDAVDLDARTCQALGQKGKTTPLDLYVMLDRSSSMAGDKWDGAKAGLAAFLSDPASAGVKVAINFFPRPPDGTAACSFDAYVKPKVAYGALPGNAQAILDGIAAQTPTGFDTPIYPALGGALTASAEEATANPGDNTAVLLVTDGEPTGPSGSCGGLDPLDATVISNLAATGLSTPPHVPTFVVGLPGVSLTVANAVAKAGGSGSAVLVTGTDVAAAFQAALAQVRGQAAPCSYELPSEVVSGSVAVDLVNVVYTHGDGTTHEDLVQDAACAGAGWRYDDPAHPTEIVLCGATCDALHHDFGGAVDIQLGCKTKVR